MITTEDIVRANLTLKKYRRAKRTLERRVIESEEWWKMRHWEWMEAPGDGRDIRPRSGWLFNTVLTRHADGIQSIPEANILPRERNDAAIARQLTHVIPCLLEQNAFDEVYSDVLWQKLKQGTGIYGVYWDPGKGPRGDISIKKADVLSLYWECGVTDIQDSRELFYVTVEDREALEEAYPFLRGKLPRDAQELPRYLYDDRVDMTDKAAVVEWYYRRPGPGGPRLHYVKYTGTNILYSSENEGLDSWYAHGQYPFVTDALFPVEGSPCGFGYIDVGKSAQEQIDLMDRAILMNLLWSARPRYFSRSDGAVNEGEFADWQKLFVHTDSNLGQDSLRTVDTPPLPAGALSALEAKIEELKQVTGNTDSGNGIAMGSNQAASAIAALQEASGKTSRAATLSAYRAFARVVKMMIGLIRQFYDAPRLYRIMGEDEFLTFDPLPLQRLDPPEFDVRVYPETRTQYTKNMVNEWAVKLYGMGVFEPGREETARMLLNMMDFDGSERLARALDERARCAPPFAPLVREGQACPSR